MIKFILLTLLIVDRNDGVNCYNIDASSSNDSKIFLNFFNWFTTTTTPKYSASIVSTEAVPQVCNPCQCGIPNIINITRIVNGTTSIPNYYPWTVYLTYKAMFYTGGVVLNNRYVLTAAHSGNIQNLAALRVVFLDHDRSFSSRSEIAFTRKVTKIVTHRQFGHGSSYNNDIALVRLDQELVFPNEYLRPICLPLGDNETYAGQTGVVTGWGTTSESGDFSREQQQADVLVWSNEYCIANSTYGNEITSNMICAGYIDGGIDACKGDSGGPLQVQPNHYNLYTLIGLVSWGKGCAEPRKPGVYTRISKYLLWIQENTKDACYCY